MKPKRTKRKFLIVLTIISLLMISSLIFFISNSEDLALTSQDRIYIVRFLKDWHIYKTPEEVHKTFDAEISFISAIQDSVISEIKGEQIPHAYFGNIAYYYQNRRGICYDRAVTLEKILLLYHFRFRHVYMYFGGEKMPARSDFFKRYLTSHAGVEVKTKKGWMAIGTDANWLGIDRDQRLMSYYDLREELNTTKGYLAWQKPITIGAGIWNKAGYKFRIIYGVYSRHGDFFTNSSSSVTTSVFTKQHHFLPDYNLRMLLYNL